MTTAAALLAEARSAGLDRLDAQLLLAHALGRTRTWLIAHDDEQVSAAIAAAYRARSAERARGVPLAYLVGEKDFHGLTLSVTADVLVPRPETELLVDWALELLAGPMAAHATPQVIDLGTGSGAIALAIKKACPRALVTAVDVNAAALTIASQNARRHGLEVVFEAGDWFSSSGRRQFDLVLGNPPYIDADDPHLAALHAEPLGALSPGRDGLAALRTIANQAPGHLEPGGWLLLEHGYEQGPTVTALLAGVGLTETETRTDLAGLARCTGGRLPRK